MAPVSFYVLRGPRILACRRVGAEMEWGPLPLAFPRLLENGSPKNVFRRLLEAGNSHTAAFAACKPLAGWENPVCFTCLISFFKTAAGGMSCPAGPT